ncbi:hypothetical protein [Mesorhizobium sp. INR15]|uniref:hypothetical protein n=1 Tax=Mesorhizobium sp. INR15 TaxID=2654248 RepID=UPI00189649A0|nr:hypothetical protein [Mesorhizobium sp. INR15]
MTDKTSAANRPFLDRLFPDKGFLPYSRSGQPLPIANDDMQISSLDMADGPVMGCANTAISTPKCLERIAHVISSAARTRERFSSSETGPSNVRSPAAKRTISIWKAV